MSVKTNQLHTAIWIYDIDKHYIPWANSSALKFWGSASIEELSSRDFKPGESEAVRESLEQYKVAFKKGEVVQKNWSLLPNGKETPAFCQFSGITLTDGRLGMLVEATTNMLDPSMQYANTVISTYTPEGTFISGNPSFIKNFGNNIRQLDDLFCDSDALTLLLDKTSQGHEFEQDILMKTPEGNLWFRISAVKVEHPQQNDTLLIHLYNIDKSKIMELSLREQALTDSLTGLTNRRGLAAKLDFTFKKETPFTILYIDLDGFKMINDSFGHGQGDKVLVEVSERLKQHQRNDEILCRFGGDEFILIINVRLTQDEIAFRCKALIDSLSQHYLNPQGRHLSLSASIGVVNYPEDVKDSERVIVCADAAMYQAKKLGKRQWVGYQQGMEHSLTRMSIVAQKLSFALSNEELALHYQPIVDVTTNKIISFEALLRWNNDELGFVNPEEAIQVAEKTGLIYEIEEWVINQAIYDLTILKKLTHADVTMSVNLSGLHLSNPDLIDCILNALNKHKLPPEDLTLELTESVLFTSVNQKNCPIKKLTEHKIKINIDDFGTGYSSLAYLHIIPASVVKVDKSFLENMKHNTVVLECIERLIHSLAMESLIEGIETKEQSTVLALLGYHLQQGYFHGRPQPINYYYDLKNS